MSKAATRAYFARENLDETPLTDEEQLLVAPPDVQEQDPAIAEAIVQEQADDAVGGDVVDMLDASAEIDDTIDTLQAAGPDVTAEAVAVATERLNRIYRGAGLPQRKRMSREEITAAGPFDEATELVSEARGHQDLLVAAATEGLKEIFSKLSVNSRNFFKWRSTFAKDAKAVAAAAAQVTGAPKADAKFTNAVRIAHFSDAEKNPKTSPKELVTAFEESTRGLIAMEEIIFQLARVFTFFNKSTGTADFDKLFESFKRLDRIEGGVSLTGGLYGEDWYATNIPTGTTSDQKEFLQKITAVRIQGKRLWSVNDMKDVSLPPMPAKDIARFAGELDRAAELIKTDYDIMDKIHMSKLVDGEDNAQSGSDKIALMLIEFLSNPKIFMAYRGRIKSLVSSLFMATNELVDLKAKALSCLLDYYKWSLANHEKGAPASTQADPEKTE